MSTGLSVPFFPAPVAQTDGVTESAASQNGAGATTDSSLPLWNPLDPCDLDFLPVGDSFTQEIVALSESFLTEGAGSATDSSCSGSSSDDSLLEGHGDDDDAEMVDTIQQLLDLTSDQHLVEELLGDVTESQDDQVEVKIDPILLEERDGLDSVAHGEMKTYVPVEPRSSPAVGRREETVGVGLHSFLTRKEQPDAVHAVSDPHIEEEVDHAVHGIIPTPQPRSINTTEPLHRTRVLVKPTATTDTLSPSKKTAKCSTVVSTGGAKALTARPPLARRLILPKSSRPIGQQPSGTKHKRIVLVLSPKQLQQVRDGHTKIVLASRTTRKDPLAGVPPDQKPPPAASSSCVFDNRDCSDWMIPLDALLEDDDAVLPTAAAHQLYAQPADIPDDLQDLVLDNVVSAETAALPYDSANTLLEELMVSDQLQLSSFPDEAGLDHMTEQLFPSHQLSQAPPHASPVPQLLSLSEMMSGTPSPPPLSSPQQSAMFTGYYAVSTPPSPICHGTTLTPSIPNKVAPLDDTWNESVRRECEAVLKTPTTVASSIRKQQKQQRRRAVDPYSRPSTTAVTSDLQQETGMTSSSGGGAKLTDAQRREKKRLQNKLAATRYREKKRMELSEVALDEDVLEQRNSDLKERVHTLTRELDYLRQLMRQVLQHKQVI